MSRRPQGSSLILDWELASPHALAAAGAYLRDFLICDGFREFEMLPRVAVVVRHLLRTVQ